MNYSFLMFTSDVLKGGLQAGVCIPFNLLMEDLDFIDDEKDGEIINKYIAIPNFFETYRQKILTHNLLATDETEDSKSALIDFLNNCNKIHENHEDIDIVVQAATRMLMEKVLEKYFKSYNEWLSTKHLLPRRSDDDNPLKMKM